MGIVIIASVAAIIVLGIIVITFAYADASSGHSASASWITEGKIASIEDMPGIKASIISITREGEKDDKFCVRETAEKITARYRIGSIIKLDTEDRSKINGIPVASIVDIKIDKKI